MAARAKKWKKGRGKLGVMEPVLGRWVANAESPQGRVRCSRTFTKVLDGKFVQLVAEWRIGKSRYEEIALYGAGSDGRLGFWSFTSDEKRSEGKLVKVSEVHPEAFGFEAKMAAGRARMVLWPAGDVGFHWAVEAKTKKGWRRFTEHHYKRA